MDTGLAGQLSCLSKMGPFYTSEGLMCGPSVKASQLSLLLALALLRQAHLPLNPSICNHVHSPHVEIVQG
jgi:hypothetical protein